MDLYKIKILFIAVPIFLTAFLVSAQLPAALDVTCSISLRDANGSVLTGNNPLSGSGYVAGGRVQLFSVGSNGKIDIPAVAGDAGGDDLLLAESQIGQGMVLAMTQSGRFSFSVIPAPAEGTRMYVRVYNHADPLQATSWGQSAAQALGSDNVLDVGQLGLEQISMPTSGDVNSDTDGDGLTDFEELVANTNAQSGSEAFRVTPLASGFDFEVDGSAGRDYVLLRSSELTPQAWFEVDRSGVLGVDNTFILTDGNPPSDKAVYKVGVSFPELN